MREQDYRKAFSGLRRNIRGLYRRDGLARLGILFFGWSLATFTLDYFLHFPWLLRALHLGLLITAGVYCVQRYLRYPLSRKISDDDLALAIESTHPELHDKLISAVQLERAMDTLEHQETKDMARVLIEDVKRDAGQLDVRTVVDAAGVNRSTWIALALAGGLGLCTLIFPVLISTWVQRDLLLTNTEWPQRVYLEIRSPFDLGDPDRSEFIVAQGRDVDVVVFALEKGDNPGSTWIHYTTSSLGGERTLRQGMASTSAQPRRYGFTFRNLREDITFYVSGGDDETRKIRIKTLVPPTVRSPEVTLIYPDYTGLPMSKQPSGDVRAPVGTRVLFAADTNKRVRSGELVVDIKGARSASGSATAAPPGEGSTERIRLAVDPEQTHISGELIVTTSTTYTISLESDEGMLNERAAVYQIIAQPDVPPRVRVREPGRSLQVTPIATVPFAGDVIDDYGITSVTFRWTDARSFRDVLAADANSEPAAESPESPDEGEESAGDQVAPKLAPQLVRIPLPFRDRLPESDVPPISYLTETEGSKELQFSHALEVQELRVRGGDGKLRAPRAGDRILYQFASSDIGPGQEGTSPDYEITVVSLRTLEADVKNQIKDVQERLKRMYTAADRVADELKELIALSADEMASAQLTAAEARQGRLTRDARWIEDQLAKIRTTKERNRMSTAGELDDLARLAGKASVAADHASNAEADLAAAARSRDTRERSQRLTSAETSEQALLATLSELIKELAEYEDFQSIVRVLRNLRSAQDAVHSAAVTLAGVEQRPEAEDGDGEKEKNGREKQDDEK